MAFINQGRTWIEGLALHPSHACNLHPLVGPLLRQHAVFCLVSLGLLLSLLLARPTEAGAETLRDLGNGICLDSSSGLMWQIGHSRSLSDVARVKQYIADLNLGGVTGWRLPTTRETKGLRLLIDIHGNGACNIEKPQRRYWMRDEKKGVVPIRLELESFCRGIYSRSPGSRGYVRAVRDTEK